MVGSFIQIDAWLLGLCVGVAVLVGGGIHHLGMQRNRRLSDALDELQRRHVVAMEHSQRERAELTAIFDHMPDGLLVLGADERVLLRNLAAERLLDRAATIGRPLPEVVRDAELVQIARAASDSAPVKHLIEMRPNAGGPRRWLQVIATRLPAGELRLVLLQDVTELRAAEASRLEFVANVSHELRTPVASLKALVETLEGGAKNDPVASADFLRRMHIEVDGLAHLVTEVLALARADAGRLDLHLESCNVDELLRESTDRIGAYAERVGLSVALDSRHAPNTWVCADPRRVGQVLANLLANAIKFTPPGGSILVGACPAREFVEIWVADCGVGIEPDELVRIFERFYKIDPSRSGPGTGLGLAISKHVVQAHGGQIWAESAGPGRGATFRFVLPIGQPPDRTVGLVRHRRGRRSSTNC